ncbi:Cyclic phosphodiesterase [Hibiscus syriacus]|uniref:Cyclic phosphodiesterase n=1 Tax=Hibiscus syriacus TaxID=106335 RepID=A0A6A3CNC9_HIBSY|nr:cyclic phosphodiesterase-like [Hibiscus syriacus]KAE8728738.1 Cyclic phosphodiesterase [Hibiscus syriacus]
MRHLTQVAILKSQTQFFYISKTTNSILKKELPISIHCSLTPRSISISTSLTSMATPEAVVKKDVYSVWALPPEDVTARVKKVMEGLRSEFGGPQFEPHVTVVGAISLAPDDALAKFRAACDGLKPYNATVDRVATGTFFYQCVFLLLHPTSQVVETSEHCSGHFGYKCSSPYMPHLSLLYADISEEEKKKAQEKTNMLDESIGGLSFEISRLALYKTDTKDKTLKSWEKVAECNLSPN